MGTLAGLAGWSCAQPTEAPAPSDFARFTPIGENEGLFETSVTTYRDAAGRTVTLVAAVHIADARHYRELNRLFKGFEAVLYELVAEEGTRPRPGRASGLLSMFQRMLKSGLGLEFQLDAIDYSAKNLVHADLDPRSFARLQEEKGENLLTLMLRAMGAEARRLREEREKADQKGGADSTERRALTDLVTAFRRRRGRHLLRLSFARQLEQMEALAAGFSGKDGKGSVLVEGRNARAFEVLDSLLKEGKRNLAIYYGAAHMPDMEERLAARGFEKVDKRWLVAWDIHERPDPPPAYKRKKRSGGATPKAEQAPQGTRRR